MAQLEADDLRSRLRFDYQTVMLMRCPLMVVEAYRNLDDLLARRSMIVSETEGHLAAHYRVKYNIKTLVGRGRYSDSTTVRFDLFGNINYPFNDPVCWVIDSEMPWSPHFFEDQFVCIGDIWTQAQGKMLLGELMVHVAKLLNFDEPEYANPDYTGWRPDAVEYWVKVLGRQPISRSLVYPRLPMEVLPQEPKAKSAFVKRQITGNPAPAIKFRATPQTPTTTSRIKLRTH